MLNNGRAWFDDNFDTVLFVFDDCLHPTPQNITNVGERNERVGGNDTAPPGGRQRSARRRAASRPLRSERLPAGCSRPHLSSADHRDGRRPHGSAPACGRTSGGPQRQRRGECEQTRHLGNAGFSYTRTRLSNKKRPCTQMRKRQKHCVRVVCAEWGSVLLTVLVNVACRSTARAR